MKQPKENWITDRCQEIDSGFRTRNSWAAFNSLKLLTQRQQTKAKLIENANTKLLTEETAIHKRCTEYYTEMCNSKLKTYANILNNVDKIENREKREAPVLKEEEEDKAVRMLKNDKILGVDDIPAKVLIKTRRTRYYRCLNRRM